MGSRHTEEFALDDAASPSGERSAGPEASGDGPAGPDGRRRSSPGWRHSPGLWVAAAVVLVVVGAAVSPQGEPLEPRPPDTVWTASAEPGRAPGLWVLTDSPVVATADGLTAYEPTTGEPAWTVPLDDPSCTATDQVLTCVHGEGESATIAIIDAAGDVTDVPFPGADVAATVGDDLIVGGAANGEPWLGRFTVADRNAAVEVWRYQPELPFPRAERWTGVTVSQGVATAFTNTPSVTAGPSVDLAAAVETGQGRPAVVHRLGGIAVSNVGRTSAEWHQQAPPMAETGPEVAGHSDLVFTLTGARARPGGELVLSYSGLPLLALGDDLIYAGTPPGRPAELTGPGEIAVQLHRVDVLTGDSQWEFHRASYLTCPCATNADMLALVAASSDPDDSFVAVPQAMLGIDLNTGRHHWSVPISTAPDAIAADADHVYVLSAETLTAYTAR